MTSDKQLVFVICLSIDKSLLLGDTDSTKSNITGIIGRCIGSCIVRLLYCIVLYIFFWVARVNELRLPGPSSFARADR